MNPIQVTLKLEEDTKRYYRYEAMKNSLGILNVYVSKEHLKGEQPPAQVKVTVEAA